MEKALERIENKIDKLDGRIDNIDVTLGKQHVSLEIHIKRTNILEEEVRKITKHVNYVRGFFVILAFTAGLLLTFKDLLF